MFKPRHLSFFLIVLLFGACKTESKYNYAIKDFRKSLQPYLTEIVSKGIVMYYDSSLRHMATDKELIELGQSEHPVLRASAYREMSHRKSFNHFDIFMHHLDDTAVVATDGGEWGIWYRAVSDDIIEEAKWKNIDDKSKTIDEVITKHNYLRAAYSILSSIQPQEKYYPYIKDMAIRERKSIGEYGKRWIADFEFALYGLAKFKKKEDIKLIKDLLILNDRRISELSFTLMKEFPDTAYLEVFETYYPRNYYRTICMDRSTSNAVNFIHSIAIYKCNRSAKILDSILNKKTFVNCTADTFSVKHNLIYAIWDNPCDAYSKLRKQIEGRVKNDEKNKISFQPVDSIEVLMDTSVEKISWSP